MGMAAADWIAIVGITVSALVGLFVWVTRSMGSLHKDLSEIKQELAAIGANQEAAMDLQKRFWDKLSKLGDRVTEIEVDVARIWGVIQPRRELREHRGHGHQESE